MNRTKIEWCDYTVNPVKGVCPVGCSYCYARRLYKRFKWNPKLRYDPLVFMGLPAKPSRIFVGSMMELFHPDIWTPVGDEIIGLCKGAPQHNFIFLTKQPENLPREWPDNCWVGVTATDYREATDACGWLDNVQATVKFLSIQPLLSWNEAMNTSAAANWFSDLGLVIIGQQTPVSKKTMPRIEWVAEIVQAADKAGVAVFLKDNLLPLLTAQGLHDNRFWRDRREERGLEPLHLELRQEFPTPIEEIG